MNNINLIDEIIIEALNNYQIYYTKAFSKRFDL